MQNSFCKKVCSSSDYYQGSVLSRFPQLFEHIRITIGVDVVFFDPLVDYHTMNALFSQSVKHEQYIWRNIRYAYKKRRIGVVYAISFPNI